MVEIFKTIWGQTKLARSVLAIGTLIISGILLVNQIAVPEWWTTLTTTAVLSYFITRTGGEANGGA